MGRKYLRLAGAGASFAACAAIGVTASSAATHRHATTSGTVHVYVTGQNNKPTLDLVVGAINDHGTDVTDPKNKNYELVKLSQGSFDIDSTKLNRSFKPIATGTGCAQAGSGHGAAKILNGTGAYAGITGTLELTLTYVAVGKVVNGKCTVAKSPTAQNFIGTGSGHVSY